jgi:chaperonin GroEL (HSP60 family)
MTNTIVADIAAVKLVVATAAASPTTINAFYTAVLPSVQKLATDTATLAQDEQWPYASVATAMQSVLLFLQRNFSSH